VCWKGCDFAMGRVNNPELRVQAEGMCRRYIAESYKARPEDFNITDLRIHTEMYPTDVPNMYRACLAGIRRQTY
jgi:hypothetical protein